VYRVDKKVGEKIGFEIANFIDLPDVLSSSTYEIIASLIFV